MDALGADVTLRSDLVYSTPGGVPLALDLFLPAARPAPVVLYLHGGGWRMGSRRDLPERPAALARRGFAVAAADYRLSGQARWPAQVEDVHAAVDWLHDHGDEYGIDTSRVAAWGASAGAQLAAMAALTQPGAINAVVSWFITSDLERAAPRPPVETALLPDFEAELLGVADVHHARAAARAASPRWHARPDAPPFLIMHGDRDRIVPLEQSRVLHDALVDAGAESTLIVLGGATHEDPAFDAPPTTDLVAAFLRGRGRPTTDVG